MSWLRDGNKRQRAWRNFDFVLLLTTLLLIAYGVAMIYSAISDSPGLQDLPQRQVIYAAIGLIAMFLLCTLDYRSLLDIHNIIYFVALVLLVVVLIVGQITHGAQRWVDLKYFPLQPSELSKLLLTIVLAGFFAKHEDEVKSLKVFVVSLLYVLPVIALIFLEPSLSAALSLAVLWLLMAFVAGVRLRYFIALGGIGMLVSPLAWASLAEYQRDRVTSYVASLLQGGQSTVVGYDNAQQALISIGSGGFLGKGFALGSQSQLRFLRVRWSDFIFSVIGEELGMLGIVILFILLLIVIMRLFRNAEIARDLFGRLIIAGVGALILFQSVVNIGMNLGLLPATGIPLPFISSGGSSLITLLLAQGIVQSVNLRRQRIEYPMASRV